MNKVFTILFVALLVFAAQASAQITIDFQAISTGTIGTYDSPTSRGTAIKSNYLSVSDFGFSSSISTEISNNRKLKLVAQADFMEFGPFPGGIAASQFDFWLYCMVDNHYRKGIVSVTVLNSSKVAGLSQTFEVSSNDYTSSTEITHCYLTNPVPAGGYILITRTSPTGANTLLSPEGVCYVDNIVIRESPVPSTSGVIDFQHSTIIGLNGQLESFASPTTIGAALKAAYPIISNFGGMYHYQAYPYDDWFPTEGGLELGNHTNGFTSTSSHMMMLEHPRDFIELGPFPYGVDAGQIFFSIFAYAGSSNYTKGRIRATVLNSLKQGVGSDSSGVFFETSSSAYTTSEPQTLCIFPNAIPVGGYIRLTRSSLWGDSRLAYPNGNFWIDDISYASNLTPVELLSFRSYVKNGKVDLHWKTATELNNYGFEIERSSDKQVWTNIGFVNGHGTSLSPKEYTFTDEQIDGSANVLYYRLLQIDRDGTTEYSSIVSAELGLSAPTKVSLSTFPQPFADELSIKLSSPIEEDVVVTLFNSALQKISIVYEGRVSGATTIAVNTDGLLNGMYFLITETASRQQMVQRIVKMH